MAVSGVIGMGVMVAGATPAPAIPIGPGCPALYVIGVQGTGQSSPSADPLADTGVVGAVIAPVLSGAPGLVQRSYIPYTAGFGGAVPGGGPEPYAVSVIEARRGIDAAVTQIAAACPHTLIAGIGYSQGAQAMSSFAHDVGAGAGPVAADRIAGVALYAHPDRAMGSPVFPGRPGQTVPDPAPGTAGAAVSTVQIANPRVGGGGIADGATSYGALTGRVADICTDGDLACSAPDHAALLRIGAEIAAQADLRDPVSAINSMHTVLAAALGDAWTTAVLNDFQLTPHSVDYIPRVPLSQRVIDAADPRNPAPSPQDHSSARARWSEIATTATANPITVIPTLAGQLSAAWGQLVADNADLLNPAVWVHFADTIARHNNYAATGEIASGVAWMVALAHDLAGNRP